jgi:hypothetical protein
LQIANAEKQEILELENYFVLTANTKTAVTEANSQLLGQVMKFDPT